VQPELAHRIDQPTLDALLALGHRRSAAAGDVLLHEGEAADRVPSCR
jgi:hypothetical protein